MWKKILLGLVALIVLFLGFVALQPGQYVIERETVINAPPAVVFAHINDFRRWESWSPWAKLDPQMKTTYEGAESGTGAIMKWVGNDKVGEGQMTILESETPKHIKAKLEFFKPWQSTATSAFVIAKSDEAGTKSRVVWSMSGQRSYTEKLFTLLMNLDKLIGADFEKGLASLKALAEKPVATTQ